MSMEVISDRQGISIVTLFIMGSTMVLGTAVEAGRDLWISICIAIIAAIPMALAFARLLAIFPGKDIFQIAHYVFGNILGKLFCILFTWFGLHLGSLVLTNFGMYMKVVALPETPRVMPSLVLALLCIWATKEGIEIIGRLAKFGLIFVGIMVVMTVVLLTPQWEQFKITPILANGWGPVLKGALSAFTFPLIEIVLFTAVLSPLKKKVAYKTFLFGLVLGGFIVFIASFNEIMVLGPDLYSISYFPAHTAAGRINIGDFVQRLEIAPAVGLLISGLIKISICLLAVSKGLARIFNFDDYRFLVLPLGLMMVNLSEIFFSSVMQMMEFAAKTWKIYALPFEVALPLIVLLAAEVKVRMDKNYPTESE